MTPRWTIITVTHNSSRALRLHWRKPPHWVQWIVVDNASSDDSVEVAERLGAETVPLTSNIGFAAGNNLALAMAESPLVLFANPDLEVQYQDLRALETILDDREMIVAPQLLNADGSHQPNGRGLPSLMAKIGNRIPALSRPGYRIISSPGETRYACWLMGAAVAGHTSVFLRLGGWDERYFVYYEDHAMGISGWLNGVPSAVCGSVRWKHGWARETKHLNLAAWRLEAASARRFFSTYPSLAIGMWPKHLRGTAKHLVGTRLEAGGE